MNWEEPTRKFSSIGSDWNEYRETSQGRADTGDHVPITPDSNPYSSASSLSFMARSRYFDDAVAINEEKARSYPEGDADRTTEDDIQLLRL